MERQKAAKDDKVYVFRASLDLDSPKMWAGKVNQTIRGSKKAPWREIVMLGSHTLYDFAEAINDAFGFMFDHCFGFYNNLGERTMYDSKEIYELFSDSEDVERTPGAKGVEKTKISKVFNKEGKKMLFYFDYGDGWSFIVELKDIENPEVGKLYPILRDSQGGKPEQYPPLEEEESEIN